MKEMQEFFQQMAEAMKGANGAEFGTRMEKFLLGEIVKNARDSVNRAEDALDEFKAHMVEDTAMLSLALTPEVVVTLNDIEPIPMWRKWMVIGWEVTKKDVDGEPHFGLNLAMVKATTREEAVNEIIAERIKCKDAMDLNADTLISLNKFVLDALEEKANEK